jgi:hypothetical protein
MHELPSRKYYSRGADIFAEVISTYSRNQVVKPNICIFSCIIALDQTVLAQSEGRYSPRYPFDFLIVFLVWWAKRKKTKNLYFSVDKTRKVLLSLNFIYGTPSHL